MIKNVLIMQLTILILKHQKSKAEMSDLLSDKKELVKEVIEKELDKKNTENEKLKDAFKHMKEEKDEQQKEIKNLSNRLKSIVKENHNLTSKNENLVNNLSNFKQERYELSIEKTKAPSRRFQNLKRK